MCADEIHKSGYRTQAAPALGEVSKQRTFDSSSSLLTIAPFSI